MAPVPRAINSAIYNAIGVWIYEFPFIPDRLLAGFTAAGRATPAGTPVATPST